MKTFSQFLLERDETRIPRNPGESMEDYAERVRAAREARRAKFNQDAAARSREGQSFRDAYNRATGRSSGGGTQTPPRSQQPAGGQKPPAPSSTSKQPGRLQRIGTGVARQGAYAGADIAADVAIDQIKDPKTRENVRTVKDFGLGSAALYTNPITSIALGGIGPSSSAPAGIRDVGAYRIRKRIDPSAGEAGFDKFLATGKDKKGYTYNDPNAEKIWAYRRDRVGSKKPEDKPFDVGAAKLGGQVFPVEWGSVAGVKKVGTPAQAQARQQVQQSRQQASRAGVYGATKGSGIVGIGGKTTFNTRSNTITTAGRTAALPRTQILPGGKVGDLAYRGGKAVYIARGDIAKRGNQSLLARLSRSTGIGGQRQKDAAAIARERMQAMKSTARYRQQLGITGTGVSKPPKK